MTIVVVFLVILGFIQVIHKTAERRRDEQVPRCTHGVRGSCNLCALETEIARRRAEAQASLSIDREYWLIPEEKRHELRRLAEEHISRNAIATRPGDVESAVVNMWRRSTELRSVSIGQAEE